SAGRRRMRRSMRPRRAALSSGGSMSACGAGGASSRTPPCSTSAYAQAATCSSCCRASSSSGVASPAATAAATRANCMAAVWSRWSVASWSCRSPSGTIIDPPHLRGRASAPGDAATASANRLQGRKARMARPRPTRGASVIRSSPLDLVGAPGPAVRRDVLAHLRHHRVVGAVEVDWIAERLVAEDAGVPVDLQQVVLGIVEVDADRVAMGDRAVDAGAGRLQPLVVRAHLGERAGVKRELLELLAVALAAAQQEKLVVLGARLGAHEVAVAAARQIGHLEAQDLSIEVSLLVHVVTVEANVADASDLRHGSASCPCTRWSRWPDRSRAPVGWQPRPPRATDEVRADTGIAPAADAAR